jgi:hypothetical protein
MMKKVLSVALALVLALGVCAVAVSAASATDLEKALAKLPSEYNAQFYNDNTASAILAARAQAAAALASGDAAAIDEAYTLCVAARDLASASEERYIEADDDYLPYYVNRDESKATVTLDMATDAAPYLKSGDTFNVTISMDANFIIRSMAIGFAYDATKLEYVSASYPNNEAAAKFGQASDPIYPDWTHLANGREKVGSIPETWTAEQKAQYNILVKLISHSVDYDNYVAPDGKTEMFTVTFKVKENVPDGEALIFFDHAMQATFENNIMGEFAFPSLRATRAYGADLNDYSVDVDGVSRLNSRITDAQATVDQTFVFETETLTLNIGEAPLPANYEELDAAIASIADYNAEDYTEDSWAAFAEAVDDAQNCDRNLLAADQDIVDGFTNAIIAARDALELAQSQNCKIINVEAVSTVRAYQVVTLAVTAEGNPIKISFTSSDGKTYTVTRTHANVQSIEANDNDQEVWTIAFPFRSENETYLAFAKYSDIGWAEPGFRFKLEDKHEIDKNVYSWSIDGMEDGVIASGKHEVTVVTGLDVSKVQLAIGTSTATFSSSNASYNDVNGQRIWTINYKFNKLGNVSYAIRVRTAKTAFETSDKTMDIEVWF